jgi:hypothetical protein
MTLFEYSPGVVIEPWNNRQIRKAGNPKATYQDHTDQPTTIDRPMGGILSLPGFCVDHEGSLVAYQREFRNVMAGKLMWP